MLALFGVIPLSPVGFFASLVVLLWTAVMGVVMVVQPASVTTTTTEAAAPAVPRCPAFTSR